MEQKGSSSQSQYQKRTLGDGMDNTLVALQGLQDNKSLFDVKKLNIKVGVKGSLRPVKPKGKVVYLVPKYVPKERKQPKYLTAKPKDPKFVPYEPFKGAVDPIITPKVKRKTKKPIHYNKNNIDIHDLVNQMSEMKAIDESKAKIQALEFAEELIPKSQWEKERRTYENDIKNLRETNAHLENQLKFQAQVNSELKTLLVAAVGEDLETRVQHLTEAKLLLAKELVDSAYNLTSHQEHTEWLSGQCEVWRSKFLASSLMVEELARWKSALTNRMGEYQDNVKDLLGERAKVRHNLLRSFNYLNQIMALNLKLPDKGNPQSINITNLSELVNAQCEIITNKLLPNFNNSNLLINITDDVLSLPSNTKAEQTALKLLKNPVNLTSKPDTACNAVMGAAYNVSGGQMFLQHPTNHATCCSHCKGESKDI